MESGWLLVAMVVNILLTLLGLALMIFGILVIADVALISSKIMPLLNQVTFEGMNLEKVLYSFTIIMIVSGLLIVLIGVLFWCKFCIDWKIVLVISIILFVISFAVNIYGTVVSSKIENSDTSIGLELTKQFAKYKYDDLTSHEISTAWNYMFMELSCCDLLDVKGTDNLFNYTVWKKEGAVKAVPTGCCTGATASNYATYNDTACTETVTSGYYTQGCLSAINDILGKYRGIFIGMDIVLILIEIVTMIPTSPD